MHHQRLKKLQSSISNPILIKKKENLFYLTGRSFMHGYLLIKPTYTDRKQRNTDVVFLGDGLEKVDGVKSDFLKNVGSYIGQKEILDIFGEMTYAEVAYIKKKNPKLKIKVNIKHSPVDYQRTVKEPAEIALVKKSMQIVEKVFTKLRNTDWRRINTEKNLAEHITKLGYKFGAEDISFPAIVASGANASVPHHVPSNKKLKSGESIIIDFGFKYKNYCSDFTRTVFLKTVPKKLAMAYSQVEKAYEECMGFCNLSVPRMHSGHLPSKGERNTESPSPFEERGRGEVVTGNDLYQHAVNILAEKKLDKYFIHSLGHGTGLEIHELPNLSPKSKDVIKDNMVFSIEPGVYFPKFGGIRIEDLVFMENGQCKKFINISTKLRDNVL